MIELAEEQERKDRCLLVGEPGNFLEELESLVTTLGMECVQKITLARMAIAPAYGMGSGKAEEIANYAKELGADCIIFDFTLEPTKQRNWERLAKIPVFDRHEVILRIFAQRAQTPEAVLQVELARLEYSLPRLAHMYGDMARQRGGNYGSKGSGETQLELDQRQVREKIKQLKRELEQVVKNRDTQRKRRDKIPLPVCALVGYTNAGKSSLLNALTNADVLVEDKLFATLDPTTRRLERKGAGSVLLTDTVGFISNLPHSLVNAFKSTLEEAQRADLLLFVIDASDAACYEQYQTCQKVLEEIGAADNPRILVLNKVDALKQEDFFFTDLERVFPDAIWISAKTGKGLDLLSEKIADALFGKVQSVVFPPEQCGKVAELKKKNLLISEEWRDDGIYVRARIK